MGAARDPTMIPLEALWAREEMRFLFYENSRICSEFHLLPWKPFGLNSRLTLASGFTPVCMDTHQDLVNVRGSGLRPRDSGLLDPKWSSS